MYPTPCTGVSNNNPLAKTPPRLTTPIKSVELKGNSNHEEPEIIQYKIVLLLVFGN